MVMVTDRSRADDLRERIAALDAEGQSFLRAMWPAGCPSLKSDGPWDYDHLDAIEKAIADREPKAEKSSLLAALDETPDEKSEPATTFPSAEERNVKPVETDPDTPRRLALPPDLRLAVASGQETLEAAEATSAARLLRVGLALDAFDADEADALVKWAIGQVPNAYSEEEVELIIAAANLAGTGLLTCNYDAEEGRPYWGVDWKAEAKKRKLTQKALMATAKRVAEEHDLRTDFKITSIPSKITEALLAALDAGADSADDSVAPQKAAESQADMAEAHALRTAISSPKPVPEPTAPERTAPDIAGRDLGPEVPAATPEPAVHQPVMLPDPTQAEYVNSHLGMLDEVRRLKRIADEKSEASKRAIKEAGDAYDAYVKALNALRAHTEKAIA